jgi:hypothetical protein
MIVVSYDLASGARPCTVSLLLSTNGGVSFDVIPDRVSGAVGANVQPGVAKQILWHVSEELPGETLNQAAFRVVADDGQCTGCLLWSDPATWGGAVPAAGQAVTVPPGAHILLDQDVDLAGLTINGTLEFADEDINLQASWIAVHGELLIGEEHDPFTHQATLTLDDTNMNHSVMGMGTRGVLVMPGGLLSLHGAAPEVISAKLSAHAAAGATSLQMTEATGWDAGDQVIIAPTLFYGESQTERRTLSSATGTTLGLTSALSTGRWGLLQYATTSGMSLTPDNSITLTPAMEGTPTVLDQRATVANLTRNIVIQAPNDTAWSTSGFGVHIMVMGAGAEAVVDGVEIRRGGQRNRLGRYPFHWHMLSYSPPNTGADATGQYFRNSVVNESQNRGIVVHGTNGVLVQDNVVYDVRGHAIFLEDAVERRNTFDGNIVMRVRNVTGPGVLRLHEFDYGAGFSTGSSGFWLSHPDNTITNNLVTDTEAYGYWLAFPPSAQGESASVPMVPRRIALGTFDDNVSHSTRFEGLFIDGPELNWNTNPNHGGAVAMLQYQPTNAANGIGGTTYPRFHLNRFSVWKSGLGGVWDRAINATNTNIISADNTHRFFAGSGADGIIQRSLVIGESLNNSGGYKPNWGGDPVMSAFATYHSTFDIINNLVLNFSSVPGKRSGVFATDDYYTRGVEKGTFRNVGNLLYNAHPGYKLHANEHPNISGYTQEQMWFTLASALWDPDGNWGPDGNYLVYDLPFLTHGLTASPVLPGSGGVSVPGPFYGISGFVLHGMGDTLPQNQDYNDLMQLTVRRLDSTRTEIATWTVQGIADGAFLDHMRDFAAHPSGIYEINFPFNSTNPGWTAGLQYPTNFRMEVENMLTTSDAVLVGIPFSDAITNVYVRMSSPGNSWVGYTPVGSFNAARESAGGVYFREAGQNRIWVKVRGGSWAPGNWAEWVTTQDHLLYETSYLYIQPAP